MIALKRTFIRITAIPPGEAPAEIRAARVGVCLPLACFHHRAMLWRTAGVLSGPRTFFFRLALWTSGRTDRTRGYAVNVLEALVALVAVHPEAALWWRENAPHLLQYGGTFVLSEEACGEEPDGDPI